MECDNQEDTVYDPTVSIGHPLRHSYGGRDNPPPEPDNDSPRTFYCDGPGCQRHTELSSPHAAGWFTLLRPFHTTVQFCSEPCLCAWTYQRHENGTQAP